jgi:hypothetical protein
LTTITSASSSLTRYLNYRRFPDLKQRMNVLQLLKMFELP